MKHQDKIMENENIKTKKGKKIALVIFLLIVFAVVAVLGSIAINIYIIEKNPMLRSAYVEHWGDYDDTIEQFGEPDEKYENKLVYYNDEYVELLNKLNKLSLRNASEEEIADLNYQISTIIYKKTVFEFDDFGEIKYVYHDSKACNTNSEKKQIKDIKIEGLDTVVKYYFNDIEIRYVTEFTDGSYVKAYSSMAHCKNTEEGETTEVTFSDDFYEYTIERPIVENNHLALKLDNGIYVRLRSNKTIYVEGEGTFNADDIFTKYGEQFELKGDFYNYTGVSPENIIFSSGITSIEGNVDKLISKNSYEGIVYIPESVESIRIDSYWTHFEKTIVTQADSIKKTWIIGNGNTNNIYGVDKCIINNDYVSLIRNDGCYLYETIGSIYKIPTKIDGYPVKELGNVSLSSKTYTNEIQVKIPEGIEVIHPEFWKSDYAKVTLSSTVEKFTILDRDFDTEIELSDNGKISYASGCYVNTETKTLVYATNEVESFPNDVEIKEVGQYAFYQHPDLKKVILPDTVEKIGHNAFNGASNITELVLSENLVYIGEKAFYDCEKITNAYVRKSTSYIGAYAFDMTSITLYCEAAKEPEGWEENWSKGVMSVIWNYGGDSGITEDGLAWKLDANTSKVSIVGFENSKGLNEIKIPEKIEGYEVAKISSQCFHRFIYLDKVYIPECVEEIEESAFAKEGLTIHCEVSSQPVGWDDGWKDKDAHVVWDCKNNNVADDGYIYEMINGIKYGLKDDSAFVARQSTDIKGEVRIPEKVSFENNEYTVLNIANEAFYYCENLTSFIMPEFLDEIGDNTFCGCSSLTNVTLHDKVQRIGFSAFENCNSLESIVIPKSVDHMSGRVFSGCTKLVIYCETASIPTGWDEYWHGSTPYVLDYLNNNKDSDGYFYASVDGLRYRLKDGEGILFNCSADKSGDIVIRDHIEYEGLTYKILQIKDHAFENCGFINSVVIPDCITSIGSYAFYNCSSLTSVIFENTQGWWYSDSTSATSGTSISSSDLEDPVTAAECLTDTYRNHYWKRS